MFEGSSRFTRLSTMWLIVLVMAMMSCGYIREAYAQDVNEAMQTFIQAMAQKNPMASFPPSLIRRLGSISLMRSAPAGR